MKPRAVRNAQVRGDRKALSNMGKAGARARKRNAEINEIFEDRKGERLQEEECALRQSTNEDSHPFE